MTDEQLDEGIKISRMIRQYNEVVNGFVTSTLKSGRPKYKLSIYINNDGSNYTDIPARLSKKLEEITAQATISLCEFVGKELEELNEKYKKL